MIRFEEGGWWLPDGEQHLQGWMRQVNMRDPGPGGEERLTYQGRKYKACRPFTRGWRNAIDVGAHVGLWSWQMARDFGHVVGFEPMPEHRACWRANMRPRGGGPPWPSNARLFPYALGAEPGTVFLKTRTLNSSGDTGVEPGATEGVSAECRRLDDFELAEVDFIKIDCEGYELFVLQGAVETLKRCKPCLIVEQKPETGMEARYGIGATDAIAFLEGLGAKKRLGIQGDYIFSWDAE